MNRSQLKRWWLLDRTQRNAGWVVAIFLAAVIAPVSAAVAMAAAPAAAPVPVACPGDLIVHPGGAWECAATPTPTPTVTTTTPAPTTAPPSPTASPSPTSSSPSPTPSSTVSPSPTVNPTPTLPQPGSCPVAGTNVPGGKDPWGGCFPGPGNTGVPAGTTLVDYAGPCTITTANIVITGRHITCSVLQISAANVTIANSYLDGTAVRNAGGSFSIMDSTIRGGVRGDECCVSDRNYTLLRVELRGSYRGALCQSSCLIQDSYVHDTQLDVPGGQHGSALREGVGMKAMHNTLSCDWKKPNDTTTLGCSGDLVGYPNQLGLTTIHDNTINRNLFVATTRDVVPNPSGSGSVMAYCLYAGGAGSTNQKITDNVFQRGQFGQCAEYGPMDSYNSGGAGNVWQGNKYDNGATVTP